MRSSRRHPEPLVPWPQVVRRLTDLKEETKEAEMTGQVQQALRGEVLVQEGRGRCRPRQAKRGWAP